MKEQYIVYVLSKISMSNIGINDYSKIGNCTDELGYEEIRNLAIDHYKTNNKKDIINFVRSQINQSLTTNNIYIVCDQIEQEVLHPIILSNELLRLLI